MVGCTLWQRRAPLAAFLATSLPSIILVVDFVSFGTEVPKDVFYGGGGGGGVNKFSLMCELRMQKGKQMHARHLTPIGKSGKAKEARSNTSTKPEKYS